MPTKVTAANLHVWSPAELIAREDELRRQELASKYRSVSRTEETRRIRVELASRMHPVSTP